MFSVQLTEGACVFVCPGVDRLLFVINTIKEEIVVRVEDSSPRSTNMTDTLDRLIQETLGEKDHVEMYLGIFLNTHNMSFLLLWNSQSKQ